MSTITHSTKNSPAFISQDLKLQRAYSHEASKRMKHLPLVATEAFVRGMRDSGYKTTGTALDELIDNAIQAQATEISIVINFAEGNTSKKKLTSAVGGALAVVDNGHGMDPEMIQLATMWGGTHRENSRDGLGRYGFGLPSACVAISRSYEVYSKVPGGTWHSVRIDLDAIARGEYRNADGYVVVPEAKPMDLPAFVKAKLQEGDLPHGTVVVLDHLDGLTNGYKTTSSFKQNLLHGIGLVYRNFLSGLTFRIQDGDDTLVEPIDPLFLMPNGRFFNELPSIAKGLPEVKFALKAETGKEGVVKVRFSFMEPDFMKDTSGRFKIRKANNGIIVLRAGRQIDVVSGWHVWLPNNRYVGIELDFDPILDEEFGVTVNKQQIRFSDRVLEQLKANGVQKTLSQLFGDYERLRLALKQKEDEGRLRESEEIATKTEKYRQTKALPPSPQREQEAIQNLETEVARVAKETGRPAEQVRADILAKNYVVEFETVIGAPFYRVVQLGGQRRLYVNMAHRFFTDVYDGLRASDRMKTSLELLLLTLGECELESTPDKERFYKYERVEWSRRYEVMLEELDDRGPLIEANAIDESPELSA